METSIRRADSGDFSVLTDIWERSVRATHHFLSEDDLLRIRQALPSVYLPSVEVFVASHGDVEVGFVGMSDDTVEMLFVDAPFSTAASGRRCCASLSAGA